MKPRIEKIPNVDGYVIHWHDEREDMGFNVYGKTPHQVYAAWEAENQRITDNIVLALLAQDTRQMEYELRNASLRKLFPLLGDFYLFGDADYTLDAPRE